MVIRNAKIIDGTGNPWYKADIGIIEGKIGFIGEIASDYDGETVDAQGLVVSPGFIDMHGHSDAQVFSDPTVYNMVEQGITTEVTGMCGFTPAPVSEKYFSQLAKYAGFLGDDEEMVKKWAGFTSFGRFLDDVSQLPLGTNMAFFVGQGTVRIAAMGFESRPATEEELEQMKGYVREAMESGALGLTTGLIYPPGVYTPTEELVELCKVVAEYGGSYCSHIRNESHDVLNAMKEAIHIGKEAGVPVIISHHKVAGKQNWGNSTATLALVESANNEGVSVAVDQYPYQAGSTGLKATIPPKYHEGGTEKLLERLGNKEIREQIKVEIQTPSTEWENLALNCGLDGVLVLSAPNVPAANGKTVAEYAKTQGIDPYDGLLQLIFDSGANAGAAYFMMGDQDIERIMQHPYTMIGTDGGIIDPRYGAHPRAMGTFPRVLGRYVRDKKVLRLEDAIRKMTSLTAQKAGLKNKGLIKEGFDADLVIFNPETIVDRSTYQEPALKNEGISYVLVNGRIAVKDNVYSGSAEGRVVRLHSQQLGLGGLDMVKTIEIAESVITVADDHSVISGFSRVPYYPLVVKRGCGAVLEDVDGRKYIDLLSSAAALNTGHAHPRVVEAIVAQAHKFIHYTPAYLYHQHQVDVANELIAITPGNFPKRVAFGLSGSDAIDGMIKLARGYTGRSKIISFMQAYHGSTYGALSLSAISLSMRRRIGPFLPDIHHLQYPYCYRCPYSKEAETCSLECMADFKKSLALYLPPEEIAAVVIEPIAGDAGLIVPPKRYMRELYSICKEHGILFAVDEVQQGFGRTGKWFSIEHFDIEPDIVVMGKSIASGVPMSAIVARAEIMEALEAPAHLFTMGGNPIACQAALATLAVIRDEGLVERSAILGEYMLAEFARLKGTYELIGDVRGLGLSIGVDLVTDRITKEKAREAASKISYRCFELGVIVIFLAGNVLRIQPPLVISKEQIDQSVAVIEQAMKDYLAGRIPDEVLKFAKGW